MNELLYQKLLFRSAIGFEILTLPDGVLRATINGEIIGDLIPAAAPGFSRYEPRSCGAVALIHHGGDEIKARTLLRVMLEETGAIPVFEPPGTSDALIALTRALEFRGKL